MAKKKKPYIPKPSDESVKSAGIVGNSKMFIKSDYKDIMYKPKDGRNRIRLLAWADGRYYGLQVRNHYGVGPNNSSYICMSSKIRNDFTMYEDLKDIINDMPNSKKIKSTCPICLDINNKIKNEGKNAKDIKKLGLWPMPRTVYFVVDREAEEKGVQIWNAPYFQIDEEIRKRVVDPQTGAVLGITDPYKGYDIFFEKEIKKTPEGDFPQYTAIQIARNSSEIDIEFYNEIFDLRKILHIPEYEEIKSDYGIDSNEDDDNDVQDFEDDVPEEAEGNYDGSKSPKKDEDNEGDNEGNEDEGDNEGNEDEGNEDDEEDCFGDPKLYGTYKDCDSTCPDKKECKAKVESLTEKPSRKKHKKRGKK